MGLILEYEGKQLFKKYNIPLVPSELVTSVAEAQQIANKLDYPVAVKAQVLSGGRGKRGLIQLAHSAEDLLEKAKAILAMDDKGAPVTHLLLEQGADIKQEIFISMLSDSKTLETMVLFSMEGGVDIETLATERPEAIERFFIPFDVKADGYMFVPGLAKQGMHGKQKIQTANIIATLVNMMELEDLQLAEINPLVITAKDEVIALDARVITDDNAMFRHPERKKYLSESLRYTTEEAASKAAGMSYVDLGGVIGTLSVGAGLGMATSDLVNNAGGEVLNFLDIGGGAGQEKVEKALEIMIQGGRNRLKSILINAFGGITRTDDIARGIVAAQEKLNIQIPMIVRLSGTNIEQALDVLKNANIEAFDDMEPAIEKAVEMSKTT